MASYERYREYATASSADLATNNAVLEAGQVVVESDTGLMKIGNGSTAYTSLPYGPTTLSSLTLPSGTANGVLYLNGSKVVTSGSALAFDGAGVFTVGSDSVATVFNAPGDVVQYVVDSNGTGATASHQWKYGSTEAMRLTSTGLGIGTSSPAEQLDISKSGASGQAKMVLTGGDGQATESKLELFATGLSGGSANRAGINSISDTNAIIAFQINSTERMRLDSSGNLGLGVTPSAWDSNSRGVEILTTSEASFFAGKNTAVVDNAYRNASALWIYRSGLARASRYQQLNGTHAWFNAPSGNAGNPISFTQAMTLDTSGRLLVGATTSFNAAAKLQVQDNISLETNGTGGKLAFFSYGNDRGSIQTPATAGELRIEATSILSFVTATNVRLILPAGGGAVIGTAAIATTATDGFLYVPTCAGTPTGTPTTQTGTAPIVIDTTNHKLYFYSGGTWRDAGP